MGRKGLYAKDTRKISRGARLMRIGPHHHPCGNCRAKVECCGEIQQNYDGFPEWICLDYHGHSGDTNPYFLCEDCDIANAYELSEWSN